MNEKGRRADLTAVAGYGLLACLFFWPILFSNQVLTGFDTVTIFYPLRAAAARALLSGRLPLWNPDHFLGAPLLANPQVGVFYPLNWPFFALPPGPSLAWTMALHIVLAAVFMYAFCREALTTGRAGAWLAGTVFAFGGFMGQQTGHVNQVSVAAWLPLALLLGRRVWLAPSWGNTAALALVVALQMLAGHAQESYMILVALVAYVAFLVIEKHGLRRLWAARRDLAGVVAAVALGFGLAAVQLAPTAELSGLSIRSGGLSFRQASSFSLDPQAVALSLLPNYAAPPPNEMGGYVGVVALALAICGALWCAQRKTVLFLLILGGGALLLALGRYTPVYWTAYYALPGVSFFRVPARWLLVYSFAVAALAGAGLDALKAHSSPRERRRVLVILTAAGAVAAGVLVLGSFWLRLPPLPVMLAWGALGLLAALLIAAGLPVSRPALAGGLLIALVVAELYSAGRFLEYNRYSAPEVVSALRPALAYLQTQAAASGDDRSAGLSPLHVLSVSDATWDPGDLAEIKASLTGLAPARIADYVDAVKNKELLTANLPSLFGLQTADGYDGGVLPLRRFVDMEGLFLPVNDLSPDGRLRDHLSAIPEARLLALLSIGYAITDKNHDVWLDDVYYDLSFATLVTHETTLRVTAPGVATAVGVIARLEGGAIAAPGKVVAQIIVSDASGRKVAADVIAGESTARTGEVLPLRSVLSAGEQYYHAVLALPSAIAAQTVLVRYVGEGGALALRGLSLIDGRTGASQSVSATPDFRLVHSGDVKIYRNLRVLPRAYVVHKARTIAGAEEAVAAMRRADFDPQNEVILAHDVALPTASADAAPDTVSIVTYEAERVVVQVQLGSAGLLILSDADYPGWRALVDGAPATIVQANGMFRAVALSAGEHRVEFIYRPLSLVIGALITLASLAVVGGMAGLALRGRIARGKQGV